MRLKKRIDQDSYFMMLALLVSTRSTCLRTQVGAVLVKDNRVISTGYNGAPRKMPHCWAVGCLRKREGVPQGKMHEICRAVHAEMNCIIWAALNNSSPEGGTIYTTHHPCSICARILINAGIARIVYLYDYPDDFAKEILKEAYEITGRPIVEQIPREKFAKNLKMISQFFGSNYINLTVNKS